MPRDSMAKLPPMSDEQMEAQVKSHKVSSMYDKKSEWREQNDAQLSRILEVSLVGLNNVANPQQRISLTDTEIVKSITIRYMVMCQEHHVLPSFLDIASAIGYTRQGAYSFMKRNPDHPTSIWLRHLRDVISDALAKSAMTGATAPIPSIFVLKSQGGWREDVDDMPQHDQKEERMDADAIVEKYGDLPDD